MNETVGGVQEPIFNGAPVWLTLPFALIALGVVMALFILWRGALLAKRRNRAWRELEADGAIHEGERSEPAPAPAPIVAPTPTPTPVAAPPAPPPAELPASPEPEVAADPAPLADEPIAAAAPMDAAPATLAASAPSEAETGDDLTRMKGVGPKLAQRLNAAGITRFAQIAALSPTEAEALDAKLGDFRGRMQRDRWIEQAGFLATDDRAGYEAVFGKL